MTGRLRIGAITAGIETVAFADGIMRLAVTLGPDVAGHVGGMLAIEGEDGTVCWRGAKVHDYGTKLPPGRRAEHLAPHAGRGPDGPDQRADHRDVGRRRPGMTKARAA